MRCMRVDLPEPDAPMMATNSPASTSRETPARARTSTSPAWYTLVTLSIRMSGAPSITAPLQRAPERRRHVGARRADSLGDQRVTLVQVPLGDFGDAAVGDAGAAGDRLRLPVAQHPDDATIALGARRTRGDCGRWPEAQRRVGKLQRVVLLRERE